MNALSLPTADIAEAMLFADLATSIRQNLGEAEASPAHPFDEVLVRKLLSILGEKARKTATRPPRPTFVPAPKRPTLHHLPKLRAPNNTPEFQRCQADFAEKIDNVQQQLRVCRDERRKPLIHQHNKLLGKKARALERLALQAMPREAALERQRMELENVTYEARLRSYEQGLPARRRMDSEVLAAQAQWDKKYGRDKRTPEQLLKFYKSLRKDIAEFFEGRRNPPVVKKPWIMLPAGKVAASIILQMVQQRRIRCPLQKYDEERVRHAESLLPSERYCGEKEFDGYFAYLFSSTSRVLLENAEEGNAAYVLNGEWEALSKLTKQELLRDHAHCVDRAFHRKNGDWKRRIRRLLQLHRV